MSSISKDTGHIFSNDFENRDWDNLRTCPGHVLCPQMCPLISKGETRSWPTKVACLYKNGGQHDNLHHPQ